MEEEESLLLATPFGDKENGSNGSSLDSCDTDFGKENCLSASLQDSPQVVRSEDNLASPLIESPQVVSSGASPFQFTTGREEWRSILHRGVGPEAARWEGRCSKLCEEDNRQH